MQSIQILTHRMLKFQCSQKFGYLLWPYLISQKIGKTLLCLYLVCYVCCIVGQLLWSLHGEQREETLNKRALVSQAKLFYN